MKVDKHTTIEQWAPLAAYVSDADKARVKAAAVRSMFGEAGFYGMTVGQLTAVVEGDVRPLYDSGGRTVFDTMRVEAFGEFVDEFVSVLNGLKLPPTAEGFRAQAGTRHHGFSEGIYVFCRNYFGLASFTDADRLKVSEYVLARKDDYNRAVVERNSVAMMKGGAS